MLLYTNINHVARKKLGIDWIDYGLADMVYHLSNGPKSRGWCNMSRGNMAEEIGISRRSVIDRLNRLEKKKLITRSKDGKRVKTTNRWYELVILRIEEKPEKEEVEGVQNLHRGCAEFAQGGVQNLHRGCAEFAHNIYIDNNNRYIKASDTHKKFFEDVEIEKDIPPKPQPEQSPQVAASPPYFGLPEFLTHFPDQRSTWRLEADWSKLTEEDIGLISKHVPQYVESNERRYLKSAENYIKTQHWNSPIINRKEKDNESAKPNTKTRKGHSSSLRERKARLAKDLEAYFARQRSEEDITSANHYPL